MSILFGQRTMKTFIISRFFISGISAGGGGPGEIHEDVDTTTLDPGNVTGVTEAVGQPYFDNNTKREYTAAVGQPAYLHCRVKNLADRAVSCYFLSELFRNSKPYQQCSRNLISKARDGRNYSRYLCNNSTLLHLAQFAKVLFDGYFINARLTRKFSREELE